MMKFNEVLKANINFMPGALGDSIGAFQSNKIVGLQKTSPVNAIDASLIEVNMTTPITVIGFTKNDAEKITKVYPYIPFIETAQGLDRPVARRRPDVRTGPDRRRHGLQRPARRRGLQHRQSLCEGLQEVAASYPAVKGWDPVADLFKYVPEGAEVPVHAGLVRYAKEKGIDVPKRFLPPEYKEIERPGTGRAPSHRHRRVDAYHLRRVNLPAKAAIRAGGSDHVAAEGGCHGTTKETSCFLGRAVIRPDPTCPAGVRLSHRSADEIDSRRLGDLPRPS